MKAEVITGIAEADAEVEFESLIAQGYMPKGQDDLNDMKLKRAVRLTEALRILEQAGFVVLPKEELEAALKPFVRHYETWMDHQPDHAQVSVYAVHTYGDLRRAAALLAAISQETKS